jgi:oligopeptide/dipeptide ABC transporter ATP-binding protein
MSEAAEPKGPLLDVQWLESEFRTDHGVVRAVDGVSFQVGRGEIVGIVGESGCGKSAASLSVMRLLPKPYGRTTGGRILLDGTDLLKLEEREMRAVRGNRIAMFFQVPMSSLNPYLRVAEQLIEVGQLHLGLSRAAALERAVKLLERVGIPDAKSRVHDFPHELSGGMRQRVMIAMALLCDPELLIADEPTTALDVTIQAQILDLLLELCRERELSIILITHDLGVVAGTCDRVVVMYAGRIVETAPVKALFENTTHPYTRALLRSVPRVDRAKHAMSSIEGLPPRLDEGPFEECAFAPRCSHVRDVCREGEPELIEIGERHQRRCVRPVEEIT